MKPTLTGADKAYVKMKVREYIADWLKEHNLDDWEVTDLRITIKQAKVEEAK
jgi:hypothetical protein